MQAVMLSRESSAVYDLRARGHSESGGSPAVSRTSSSLKRASPVRRLASKNVSFSDANPDSPGNLTRSIAIETPCTPLIRSPDSPSASPDIHKPNACTTACQTHHPSLAKEVKMLHKELHRIEHSERGLAVMSQSQDAVIKAQHRMIAVLRSRACSTEASNTPADLPDTDSVSSDDTTDSRDDAAQFDSECRARELIANHQRRLAKRGPVVPPAFDSPVLALARKNSSSKTLGRQVSGTPSTPGLSRSGTNSRHRTKHPPKKDMLVLRAMY
ncbi:hypothetical protein DIPPA_08032 [Diplonema papillatum]|nr:hypothetical protein DIPPA_08032 [Diplonema papillatum]